MREVEFTREPISDEAFRMLSQKNIVIDIGGGSPWSGVIGEYKTLFDNNNAMYFCLDISIKGKPHIQGDILSLPFANNSADGFVVNAVLEHIANPWKAVQEIYRILKPGGVLFMYVPFLYPYHRSPRDYFRFSRDGIIALLNSFSKIKIQGADGYLCTTLRFISGLLPWGRGSFGIAYKLCKWHHPYMDRFAAWIDRLAMRFFRLLYSAGSDFQDSWYSQTSGYNVLAIK